LNFRYDINGLRAIAVIAVVLFHFNSNWVSGGFAGVDVFFVISGFLMTSIIFKGFKDDSFSLFKFYVARANRIIPALAVLCLVLLVLGWFYLTPLDYKKLSMHIASSMSFLSNVNYWRESGYFDAGSHEKWLLHTWSLSVEWQFYIIYPVVLMGLNNYFSFKNIKKLLVIGTVLGFVFNVIATMKWQSPAYFLLPTRAWEMMFGGVAYLHPISLKNCQKKFVELTGITLILFSYIFISSEIPWPGHFALLPVLGTYLVLVANRQDSIITNNLIFQALGKWSYSIYLWHWPVVVFGYGSVENWFVYGIPLSICLGIISYKFIESLNLPNYSSWNSIFKLKLFWASFLLISCSSVVFLLDGMNVSYRYAANTPVAKFIDSYKNYEMDPSGLFKKCNASLQILETGIAQVNDVCISGKKGGIFLWGDSHIGAISTGIRANLGNNIPFSQLASSGCGPSFIIKRNGFNRFDQGCDYSNSIAYDSILKTQPKIVIIGKSVKHENHEWQKTITKLHKMGVTKVIVIGPLPQWQPSLPSIYAKRHMGEEFISDAFFDHSLIKSNDFLIEQNKKYKNFLFINMLSNLCVDLDKEKPLCRAKIGDSLIAFDYGHLTLEGSKFIAQNYIIPLILPKIIK
jgi:peptidoglycan/LPS O-acetylase OafA/YrhL